MTFSSASGVFSVYSQAIDRIYDTYIDEDSLRICDDTICQIANTLEARPYSSREFISMMGQYLEQHHPTAESIVLEAYRRAIPIFVPALHRNRWFSGR
jgi:deoxyhypusine synthase